MTLLTMDIKRCRGGREPTVHDNRLIDITGWVDSSNSVCWNILDGPVMRKISLSLLPVLLVIMVALSVSTGPSIAASPARNTTLHKQFKRLCSLAVAKITARKLRGPFFVDSYAVRALCVAYDMTGNAKYLDACRQWCRRMMGYQQHMTPAGAYYMNYNRKPGQVTGDWYVADSSSIAMALATTAMRCHGAFRNRLLHSAQRFASLVMKHYLRASGGVSDGLWARSHQAWWCSSALFGSLLFVLYTDTGNRHYLNNARRVVNWMNRQNLNKQRFFPLSQQGPTMIMYVMECYSAGWPYIEKDPSLAKPALAKVNWCLHWIRTEQHIPLARRRWMVTRGWGMKFGGLPFHEYIFSRYVPAVEQRKLTTAADKEMRRLASVVFVNRIKFTQLCAFLMMSYAQRLDPGAIYRNSRVRRGLNAGLRSCSNRAPIAEPSF